MQNVGQSDNKKLENKVSVQPNSGNNGKTMSTSSIKFSSNNSSPIKSDTDSEFQPRVTDDSSESDGESVSEILLACLYLRPDLLVDSFPLDQEDSIEVPDSGSDCDNDADDNDDDEDEDDEDDEDEDEDDDEDVHNNSDMDTKFLFDSEVSDTDPSPNDTKARLEALLEAAANINPEKLPVLRHATLALDEAAQALNRMRSDSSPRDKNLLSRSLIAACTDNDVNAVRRLLGEGNSTINEATDDGDSLLSLACSAGYYELAQVLLAMSAQVEDRGQKNDCTPLMEAASAGHVDIIRLLISHGADVNAQSSTGNTPLMYACAGGHVAAVKELLTHGANVEDHNENGHTPLMEAASAGHVEVAKILLEHGAGINTHSNEFKESALTLACYKGHLDMVRFLLEAGADQEHKTDEMHTALMEASMDGHVEVARLLLDSGAQVNMPTDSFESPLTLAACGGHVDLAMLLIERGANIEEVNDEGYTPLMEAAREGHEEMVALLLSQGANINAQTEETQETALTLACCGGFTDVADYLIKNGADIELGASTPLMEAAQEGHMDLVKFLLENRANVHAQTQTGDTALTYASENGHTDVAEVLLSYHAELEHESEGGRTPLMKACRAGHICTVKYLIGKGADVNRQTTNNDHTPLSLACAGGHQAVVELLLKSGADPFHKLKDNSTMLIEAAKGGHIGVVQLLLDYPHSMAIPIGNQSGIQIHTQQQIQPPIVIQKQQLSPPQQQHQQMISPQQQMNAAPPGLHEVPEATRASNQQQIFLQNPHTKENLDQVFETSSVPAFKGPTPPDTLQLNNSSQAVAPPTDSILTQMRLLQMQAGFKEGLAHGLARAQPAVVNQIVGQTTAAPTTTNNCNSIILPQNNINTSQPTAKQKSLLRKNRQAPSFESNLTTSESQQVRSQPVGEDEIYITTNISTDEHQKKILEEFQKLQKTNIQLICDSNGAPSTLLPSTAYVDITTPTAQGLMCGTGGLSFAAPNGTTLLGQMPSGEPMQNAALATFVTGAKLVDNTFLLTAASSLPNTPTIQQQPTSSSITTMAQMNTTVSSSSHISGPAEVSQNTAISDRPKVKPVSKKDGKNLRKAAAVLQQNQIFNYQLVPTSDQNLQILQQSMANLSLVQQQHGNQQQQQQQQMMQQPQQQDQPQNQILSTVRPNTVQTNKLQQIPSSSYNIVVPNQHAIVNSSTAATTVVTVQKNNTKAIVTHQDEQQPTKRNQKVLQMVANFPNHPFQKIAQRLVTDQLKSPSPTNIEMPPLVSSPPSGLLPTSPSTSPQLINDNHDLADISRIFCEVIHDLKSELQTPQDFASVQQQLNQLRSIRGDGQSQFMQQQSKLNQPHSPTDFSDAFIDDQIKLYHGDDTDPDGMTDCGPDLSFNEEDIASVEAAMAEENSRDPICNYEWVDYIDEVINALHGVSDLPVALQEMADNLSCHDFADTYANLIGMNTFCKTRWAGHWPGTTQQQSQISVTDGSTSPILGNDEESILRQHQLQQQHQQQQQANQICTIDHQQLQQQLQQQLSVEQLQLLSHLQNQHNASLSIIPTSAIEQHLQTPNTFTLTSMPPHLTLQCQTATTTVGTTTMTENQENLQFQQLFEEEQRQLQQQQQQSQTALPVDAQQQAKLVFNLEPDKSSPPLQLLFQLPVQQGQSPPSSIGGAGGAILTAQSQQQQLTQTIAQQTQTSVLQHHSQMQQSQMPSSLHQNIVANAQQQQHQQQQQLSQAQGQLCNQHSQQVQVATQTQQQTPTGQMMAPVITHQQMIDSPVIGQLPIKPQTSNSERLKKGSDKTRKDKNRYPAMRQAPAGQSGPFQFDTTNSVQPYTIPGSTASTTAVAVTAAPVPVPQEKTIDVDSETDSNHDTALTLACAGGHEELVELLISRDADIEHRDKKGFTPLILAATAGHEKVVEALLKHGAELEAQSERTKDTPLSLACSGGRYEVVELLLNVGANKEHRNVSDYTPLSLAASGGYVNIIKLLLSHGAEINSRTGSKLGISPLMLAAMNGHTAAVKLLLDMGSDINAQIETNRNTALTLACFQGRHEVVSLLLDRKANVEHRAKTGLTPLMEAASGGYIEVGRVLLDKGADVNAAPVPSSRDTALTIAADKGHLKFVELLLARGAAVEVKNKKGNSPLWLAANGGHLAVVEILYTHGADIDSQDNRKVSCLMAAFRKGHTKVVRWMVNHVTQFPSDQEMTRYISTVSDKELLEKCHECVKVIRAAKEAQAVKANKNASILLEELDMEKTREESRKAAAARRRERKKKKKLEKKEEKRKAVEPTSSSSNRQNHKNKKRIVEVPEVDDDDDDDDDSDKDEEEEEEETLNPLNQDREEGDSGIDANSQGSCSSAEVKTSNLLEKNQRSNKSKKKKPQERSPVIVVIPENSSTVVVNPIKKKEEFNNNRNKSKDNNANTITVPSTTTTTTTTNQTKEVNLRTDIKTTESLPNNKKEFTNKKFIEKENVAPPAKEPTTTAPRVDKKIEPSTSQQQKQQQHQPASTSSHEPLPGNRKSIIFGSTTRQLSIDDYEASDNYYNGSITKPTNKNSPKQATGAGKREEGWKEVVRKSSIQQQTVAPEIGSKKVQVPVHAISRVIGRAGSNINAIRAATGAHIEVEKQGKAQGDRWITIKGSVDATKQAHSLIATLIKDPDVDILSMLPRPNMKPVPTGTSVWEKAAPMPSITSIGLNNTVVVSKTKQSTPTPQILSSTIVVPAVKTTVIVQPSVTKSTIVTTSVRLPTTKNIYTSSSASSQQTNRSIMTTRPIQPDSLPKRTVGITGSGAPPQNATKSTISYTNTIQALKNSMKNPTQPSISTSGPPGTFASKLSTTNDAKKIIQPQNVIIPSSPKHHGQQTTQSQSGLPAPFANQSNSIQQQIQNPTTIKPPFSQNSSESTNISSTTTNVRSITPIGRPVSRNVTPSPQHQQQLHQTDNSSIVVGAGNIIAPTVINQSTNSGLASQLQSKINQLHGNAQAHEYSLFNDSYSNQWENKQYSSNVIGGKPYLMENVPPPQVDASKAPGYRGTAVSSPVSSKTSSNSTTPPSQQQQPSSLSASMPTQQQLPITSQSSSNQQFYQQNEQQTVIKPISQQQVGPPSGLAVQRPVIRSTTGQLDSYRQNQEHPSARQNLFDALQAQGGNSHNLMGYQQQQQSDQLQQSFHHLQQMSRLNPKASSFSSMQQQQQQNNQHQQSKAPGSGHHQNQQSFGNMFHQNGNNNYQKMPQQVPTYNAAPGRNLPPQQHQQQHHVNNAVGGNRWQLGPNPSPREILNMENGGLNKNLGSPAMSPNNSQNLVNGGPMTNQQSQMSDERRIPRPIGTERASWKYGYGGGGGNNGMGELDIPQVGAPNWMMDKPHQPMQQQQQQQPPWMQHPMNRNHFIDDLSHPQDHFQQWQMDYTTNPMGPAQNQTNINLMQYSSFVGPTDMGPLPDKIESWGDTEKHEWAPSKWHFDLK